MAATCVVGLQWGDEAKGKITDILSDSHDFVVRFNGGANAGHTVVWGDRKFALSLLPTGVLKPHVTSVIATAWWCTRHGFSKKCRSSVMAA